MISLDNLTVSYGGWTLFDNISFLINPKDRIGLVGRNGAGKTTLLRIITGEQQPTSGHVTLNGECTIGYLPQTMRVADTTTLAEETAKAFDEVLRLEAEIASLTREIAERTDYESAGYEQLLHRLNDAQDHYHILGGDTREADIEKTLLGLGFKRTDFGRATSEFSGGWRMRIELAKLLLRRPSIFLLDEPTNHLDIESIQWLETFLATRANAVVLVSHDRAFIDNVTNRTIEISLGHIYDYRVNYSKYVQLRAERLEQQQRAYENQQKQIQDTEAFIERFRYKATKSVQVQSRIKQLEKIERIEVDEGDNSRLRLRFPPAPRSGDYPVIAKDLGKSYGDHVVFAHADFTIKRGEKVAFVGKNGEGKSTLVKCIMGEIPYDGELKIGHNVKIGYFAQNQAQLLDESVTVFDTIDRVAVGDIRTKIRDILGAFMFGGEASDKKVKVLSGGEKTRLAMIRLLLEPVNLLILDEPTNHLDMRTKDVLKQALKEFDGTLIVVSHDREFLDGLVSKVYEFGRQRVREHLGGIYDFLATKKMSSLKELEVKVTPAEKPQNQEVKNAPSVTENKVAFEARKEAQRKVKRQERAVADTEQRLAKLETEIAEIEARLATPEGMADIDLCMKHGALKKDADALTELWLEQTETLEQMRKETL